MDGDPQHDAHADAEQEGGASPKPDGTEVAAIPGSGQVDEDDADDECRLDTFAGAGQQSGDQGTEIQAGAPRMRRIGAELG